MYRGMNGLSRSSTDGAGQPTTKESEGGVGNGFARAKGNLHLSELSESSSGGLDGQSSGGLQLPSTSSGDLLAGPALPDTDGSSLGSVLSTECASVASVLPDLHLLDGLTEGSSVSDSVLSGNADFLGSLGHCWLLLRTKGADVEKSRRGRKSWEARGGTATWITPH